MAHEPTNHPVHLGDGRPTTSYTLRVNGFERPVTDAWIGESLLYVLRERLGLAGAKNGCEQGECGACSVQVDGQLVAGCLVPAALAADSEINTVEGLSAGGSASDVQQALAESGAVQCGYCTPGWRWRCTICCSATTGRARWRPARRCAATSAGAPATAVCWPPCRPSRTPGERRCWRPSRRQRLTRRRNRGSRLPRRPRSRSRPRCRPSRSTCRSTRTPGPRPPPPARCRCSAPTAAGSARTRCPPPSSRARPPPAPASG